MVPMISASSGIILFLVPALTIPTETTAGLLIMLILLLPTVLSALINCEVAIIGSTPSQGLEPWDCTPFILIRYADDAAIAGPGLRKT